MTIPDLGHCAGSGASPIEDTVEADEPASGVCAACSGRFELTAKGVLALHEPAPIDEREELELPEADEDGS